MECGVPMRSALALLLLVSFSWFPSIARGDGLSHFRRKFCDEGRRFSPSEDQSFIEMLDKLLEDSRTGFSGVEVKANDREGRFEGKAGCLWHNCQIYDGECYDCHSTKDAAICIETLIAEIKEGLKESNRYAGEYCQRTTKFASGEKSVAVNDASTAFEVCGVQYRYTGNLPLDKRSAY